MSTVHNSLHARRQERTTKVQSKILQIVKNIIIGFFIIAAIIIGSFTYLLRARIAKLRDSNIVFISDNLDGKENLIALIKIANDKTTTVTFSDSLDASVGRHGEYQLRAVYPLLQQEKYTKEQIASFYSFIFGQVVDKVIVVPESDLKSIQSQVWKGVKEGTLSFNDAVAIWWLFSSLTQEESAGEKIKDWREWQSLQQKAFKHELIPNCSLAIVNATPVIGLAQAFNHVLEYQGVEVIRLGSETLTQTESVLYQRNEFCPEVVELIKTLVPVKLKTELSSKPESEYRAELLLILGEDVGYFNLQKKD